ncbi:MAG TPA: hypothetical protein VF054_04715 [Micromonosporaceae bacterium]
MSRSPSPVRTGVAIVIGVVIAQALLVAFFSWSGASARPHQVPVVVSGPAPVAAQVEGALTAAGPDAFAVTRVPDQATADRALRDRRAYAAILAGPDGLALHVASAGSPAVAGALIEAAQRFGGGRPVPVTDVVPADPDDPHGAGFTLGFLPLAIASLAAGALLARLVTSRLTRFVGLLGYALVAGLASAAVLRSWLGILPGRYLAVAAAIGLFALAVAAATAGLGAVAGAPGIGLAVLVVFLLGNPISGLASAPELVPAPWGTIGQYLPVGAGGTVLRSDAFFAGVGANRQVVVLAVWAVVGLALAVLGRRGARATVERTDEDAVRGEVAPTAEVAG